VTASAIFKKPAGGRGIPVTPERKALFEECLNDGWPFIQIQKTHHVSWVTLNKLFPGRAMDLKVAAKLGAATRRANGQANGRPQAA
jgi:hypothetical protein